MLSKLECSESTVRSAIHRVAGFDRHTREMVIRDQSTLTVKTYMATAGGDNSVNESAAAMADHREDIDNIDFGMLVMGKTWWMTMKKSEKGSLKQTTSMIMENKPRWE